VQQFALPELTITPRIRLLDFRRFNCEAITGAALTRLVVNTAAAEAGVSLTRIARSSLVFFKPQCVAAKVNPRGRTEFVRRMGIGLLAGRNGRSLADHRQDDTLRNDCSDDGYEFARLLFRACSTIAFNFFRESVS